jgi:hypothetical protein
MYRVWFIGTIITHSKMMVYMGRINIEDLVQMAFTRTCADCSWDDLTDTMEVLTFFESICHWINTASTYYCRNCTSDNLPVL